MLPPRRASRHARGDRGLNYALATSERLRGGWLRRIFGVVLLALATLPGLRAEAAQRSPGVIALVRTPGDDALMQRLRAELSALGWRVVEVPHGADAALPRLARQSGAFAVLRAQPARRGVVLWVGDPDTERTEYEGEIDGRDLPNDGVRALRAVEHLRALWVRLENREASAKASAASSEHDGDQGRRGDAVSSSGSRSWIGVGPALSFSPGGIGPLVHAALGLSVEPHPAWAFGGNAAWPLHRDVLSIAEGRVASQAALFSVFGEHALWTTSPELRLGLAAGLARLTFEGHTSQPYAGESAALLAALASARLGLIAALSSEWRVRSEVDLGLSLPRLTAISVDREVLSWGRPLALGRVLLEYGF